MYQNAPSPTLPGLTPHYGNPIIPGYFADPSLVQYDGKFWLYATLAPWRGDTLGCWESMDFKNWTYRELDWPMWELCASRSGQTAKVWAPSVVHGRDGRFYIYVSCAAKCGPASQSIHWDPGGICWATNRSSREIIGLAST